jgi:DNA-binding SARP family transcriptional activator
MSIMTGETAKTRSYRFRCLGPLQLEGPAGARLALRTRKQLGLLFYLARRARPIARDELIELFWGEDDAKLARHSLSQCTSLINKLLGAEVIVNAGRDRLALADGTLALDVAEFERHVADGRYDEALEVWRGTLFEGIWVRRAPEFERWLTEERDKMQRLFRRLAHARIDALRNGGDHAAIRDEAERLLQHDPLDEKAMHAYLEALTLLGDRSLALRRYGEFEKRLQKELEAEPGAALKSWVKRQRKGEAPPAHESSVLPRISEITVLPSAQPFYGRTEEFSVLWKAWETAGAGRGSFIIIEGDAGIGKTALAAKLANQAHVAGGSVCFIRCYKAEKSVPFAPVTALVRQLSRLPGFVALDPRWIGELTRLVPELRERFPSVPQAMAVDDAARHRLSDATVSASHCVADEQSLMIIVDDMQYADEASLALLHYLGRQTPNQPILLIAIVRADQSLSGFERTFMETAERAGFASTLTIGALSHAAIARLIDQILAHRGISAAANQTERIAIDCAGNPLAAVEATLFIAKAHAAPGSTAPPEKEAHSESFVETAGTRLGALPSNAQAVSQAIAVAGRPLSEYELGVVTKLGPAELAAAIISLESARFVRRVGASIGLVHERYTTVIELDVTKDVRTELHLSLAAIAARSALTNPAMHFEAAQHYLGGGDKSLARRQCRAAVRYAGSVGAIREKAEALELLQSIDASLAGDDLHELCECYLHLNDQEPLRELCEVIRGSSPGTSIEFAFYEVASEYQAGLAGFEVTESRLIELLMQLTEGSRCRREAQVLLLRIADKTGNFRTVRAVARQIRRSNAAAHGAFASAYVRLKYYWASSALPLMRTALQLARQEGEIELEQLARDGVGILLKQVGRYRESIDQFDLSLGLARKTMNPHAEVACLHNRAVSEMALGDWDKVRSTQAEAERIGAGFSRWAFNVLRRYNSGIMSLCEGSLDEALIEFQRAYAECVEAQYNGLAREAKAGEAIVFQRRGDLAGLRQSAIEIRALSTDLSVPLTWIDTAALAHDISLNHGQPELAVATVDRRIRELSRRDVSHQLALRLERLILLRQCGEPTEVERLDLLARAQQLGAVGIVRLIEQLG